MRASKAGGLGRAMVWASLGVLAGCQLAFGIDPDDLPAPDAAESAGASSEGGRGGVAGLESDRAGGGQGGVSEQAGGGQGGGGQGGSAGSLPRPEPTLLASGENHTCVRNQSVTRCWGINQYGQLGSSANNGTNTPNPVPALVDSGVLTGVLQLALSAGHSCALRDDGRVLCWGLNNYGQLGTSGTDTSNPVPALVENMALGVVKKLALGRYHSCALRDDGRVLCWGFNQYGQLGTSTTSGTETPNPVPALVENPALGVVTQLALGIFHSCALRDDGRVLCWGSNYSGQLGTDTNIGTTNPNRVPMLVNNATLSIVKQLALGRNHSCALRDDGRVLCWGRNDFGQLGSSANSGTSTPTPVPALADDAALGVVKQLAVGGDHSCALRDDGRVLCWGLNQYGQLGTTANNGTPNPNPTPALVDSLSLGHVKQLAFGNAHSCALRADGRALCWGLNQYGQLGINATSGTNNPNPVPTLVDGLSLLVP